MIINNTPKISVITVSYNAVNTIEDTILSVINQTYNNIEYIIIDGKSIDGTLNIIQKYSDKITYWISEPDEGIYDAMNKGIKIASGDWVIFMNSGDYFSSTNILNKIFNTYFINSDTSVIYGDRISHYSFGEFYHKVDTLKNFSKHFPIFHQSTFIKAELIKNYLFNLQYKICSDYHQLYTLYCKGYAFQYIPEYISICECENGISTVIDNEIKRSKEDELLIHRRIRSIFYFKVIWMRIKNILRKIIRFIYPHYFSLENKRKRLLNNPRIEYRSST